MSKQNVQTFLNFNSVNPLEHGYFDKKIVGTFKGYLTNICVKSEL